MTTALILGAAVWPTGPSPALRRRTLHAAALFHAGEVSRLIACGGRGRHPPSEAEAMRDLLVGLNLPPEVIAIEDRSRTTAENIGFALALLDPDDRNVVIVTDRYHAPRARLVARRLGLVPHTAAPPAPPPSLRALRQSLREIPACLYYAATFWPPHRGPKNAVKLG